MIENRKTVFISYSWDSHEHQEWVLNLATELIEKYGIEVILDQFELSAGKDLTYFMEQSIEKSDKVLIILTPNYKSKAEERMNGVGYEYSMITQEIFASPVTKIKFLPILREGDLNTSSPKFLKSKVYHNMIDDNFYIPRLFELHKLIYDKPLKEKPVLGDIPNFNEPAFDPIVEIAKKMVNEKKINQELNEIISSNKGVDIFKNEIESFNYQLKEKAELYKSTTDLNFTYESDNVGSSIISCENITVYFSWDARYSNTAENAILEESRVNGIIKINNSHFYSINNRPKLLMRTEYVFDLGYSKDIIWKYDNLKFSTAEIIQNAFVFLISEVKNKLSKNFRK